MEHVDSRLGDLKWKTRFQFPERNLFVSLQFAKVQINFNICKKTKIFLGLSIIEVEQKERFLFKKNEEMKK
jgi:hypothetical protein